MSGYASGKGGTAMPVTPASKGDIRAENRAQKNWMLEMQQKYPAFTDAQTVYDPNTKETRETLPGVYARPTAARERFLMKQELKNNDDYAPKGDNQIQTWQSTEADIDVMMDLEQARRTFEYHTWIESLLDIKQPGNLRWIQENAPDFLQYKMNALNTALELIKREATIDALGIQSEEDLRFVFMKSMNMLRDGRSMENNRYVKGFFNPGYNVPKQAGPFTKPFSGFPEVLNADQRKTMGPWRAANSESYNTEWGKNPGGAMSTTGARAFLPNTTTGDQGRSSAKGLLGGWI